MSKLNKKQLKTIQEINGIVMYDFQNCYIYGTKTYPVIIRHIDKGKCVAFVSLAKDGSPTVRVRAKGFEKHSSFIERLNPHYDEHTKEYVFKLPTDSISSFYDLRLILQAALNEVEIWEGK